MTNRPDYDGLIEELREMLQNYSRGPVNAFAMVDLLGKAADALIQSRKDVEAAYREGYDDGWCTGTAATEEDRTYDADADWKRSNARATLSSVQGVQKQGDNGE